MHLGPQRLRSSPGGDPRRSPVSSPALRWALRLAPRNRWLEGGRRARPPRPPPQQPGSGGGVQQVRQLTREEGASSLPRPQPRHPAIPAPPAPPSESPAPRPPTQPPVPPFLYTWRAGRLGHLYIAASLRPRPRKSSKEDRNEDGALPYNKPFGRALTGLGSRTRGGGVSRAESAQRQTVPHKHTVYYGGGEQRFKVTARPFPF